MSTEVVITLNNVVLNYALNINAAILKMLYATKMTSAAPVFAARKEDVKSIQVWAMISYHDPVSTYYYLILAWLAFWTFWLQSKTHSIEKTTQCVAIKSTYTKRNIHLWKKQGQHASTMRIVCIFMTLFVAEKNSNFVQKMRNTAPRKKDHVCMYTKVENKVSVHAEYFRWSNQESILILN